MRVIRDILAKQYRGEITSEEAEKELLSFCSAAELAEFIVQAKNRGWISNFNLGIDDDGRLI